MNKAFNFWIFLLKWKWKWKLGSFLFFLFFVESFLSHSFNRKSARWKNFLKSCSFIRSDLRKRKNSKTFLTFSKYVEKKFFDFYVWMLTIREKKFQTSKKNYLVSENDFKINLNPEHKDTWAESTMGPWCLFSKNSW